MLLILTGPVHSGKTTLLELAAEQLGNQGLSAEGFLSLSIWENERVIGYDLLHLKTGERFPFIRRSGEQHWERIGPFFFVPETLDSARDIILHGAGADLLIVDEVGPLELLGKGLWPALKQIISTRSLNILLVVRSQLLDAVIKAAALDREDIRIFSVDDQDFLPALLDILRANQPR